MPVDVVPPTAEQNAQLLRFVEQLDAASPPSPLDRAWRAATPAELAAPPPTVETEAEAAQAAALLAERLHLWTGWREWLFAYRSPVPARMAALSALRSFHENHGSARRVLFVRAEPEALRALSVLAALFGYQVVGAEAGTEEGSLPEQTAAVLQRYGRDLAGLWLGHGRLPHPDHLAVASRELDTVGARLVVEATGYRAFLGRARLGDFGAALVLLSLPAFFFASGPLLCAVGASLELAPFLPGERPRSVGHRWTFSAPAHGASPAALPPLSVDGVVAALRIHDALGSTEIQRRALVARLRAEGESLGRKLPERQQ